MESVDWRIRFRANFTKHELIKKHLSKRTASRRVEQILPEEQKLICLVERLKNMPRSEPVCQTQIDFPRRKTRSQTKGMKEDVDRTRRRNEPATDKRAMSVSPLKRQESSRAPPVNTNILPVSPKKKKDNRGESKDVHSNDENVSPQHVVGLQRQKGICYRKVRRALHSSMPENILCRNSELKIMRTFLESHLSGKTPGSLYISGAPGTGKTACLTRTMALVEHQLDKCHVSFINCMALKQSQAVFTRICIELGYEVPTRDPQKFLEAKFTSPGPIRVIVLDEVDQLESKNQEILYTMFEWPSLPKSKLILIGIANALDLTDRILPRLQSRPKCKPELLHFAPYTKEDIVAILKDRVTEASGGVSILDPAAIQFCARKVAATTGDMRKALDICRRAVEIMESDVKKQTILQPVARVQQDSPRLTATCSPKPKAVGICEIAGVVAEVYGSRMMATGASSQPTIPLQQKLLICVLLLLQKEKKVKEVTLGKLHDTYCSICVKRKVTQINQEDVMSLCNLLETRGILSMKKAKEARLIKVALKLDEKEVDLALQDKTLLSSILHDGVPRE